MRLIWENVPRLVFWPSTRCFLLAKLKNVTEATPAVTTFTKRAQKNPPKNQKTQTTKKDSAFFECKVQVFWRDFSKGFNIPKENFSVARR